MEYLVIRISFWCYFIFLLIIIEINKSIVKHAFLLKLWDTFVSSFLLDNLATTYRYKGVCHKIQFFGQFPNDSTSTAQTKSNGQVFTQLISLLILLISWFEVKKLYKFAKYSFFNLDTFKSCDLITIKTVVGTKSNTGLRGFLCQLTQVSWI